MIHNEQEYLNYLKTSYIPQKTEYYKAIVNAKIVMNNAPIRGDKENGHDLIWFWNDHVWCGDAHIIAYELFMGPDFCLDASSPDFDLLSQELADLFEEAFKETDPELHAALSWE